MMKLKHDTIRKRCKVPIPFVKFLDLSGLELSKIENLDQCDNLHWLNARDNNLQSDEGLENLKQLWYLDLSNNNICYLNALSRYLALGTVILTNNNLKWIDLEKIRHAHFLSISLHGNPCLDSDPYYRIHVIDCLPLIWELDGRLVTVMERLHVKQFFVDTALTPHPIRHKMGRTFRTTAIKNIGVMGVVSKQCKYIYSKFPMSEKHTKHTDERRLRYLTHMTQEDILNWVSELDRKDPMLSSISGNFLVSLLEQRQADVEGCNMFLLLLVISLEYELPTSLMRSSLNVANLESVGLMNIMSYFLLPPTHRTRVICLLLNAAKVDRDNNVNNTGGLYPQLFMSLYYALDRLIWISQTSEANRKKVKPDPYTSDYRALMAGEAVSLMLNIPKFLHLLCAGDTGVANLILTATGSCAVVDEAQDQLIKAEDVFNELPMRKAHNQVKTMLLEAIHKRMDDLDIKMSDIPVGDRYLALSDCLPIRPLHSVIWASEYLTKGQTIPKLDPPILNPAREAAKNKPQEPKIGDKLLLGPQVIGDITMLLKGDIALAKIDGVPVANGAIASKMKDSEAHYTYVDLKALCFAKDIGMWRPISAEGDKFTIHTVGNPKETLSTLASLSREAMQHSKKRRFTQSLRFSIDSQDGEKDKIKINKTKDRRPTSYFPANKTKDAQDSADLVLQDGYTAHNIENNNSILTLTDREDYNNLNLDRLMTADSIQQKITEECNGKIKHSDEMLPCNSLETNVTSRSITDTQQGLSQSQGSQNETAALDENTVFLTSVKDQEEGVNSSSLNKFQVLDNKSTVSNISRISNMMKENKKLKMSGRSIPVSAKSAGSLFPPPQRPSSPTSKLFILRPADADRWLGGGRDLYWEQMRQRPKSGHTPGWKEGLPISMQKSRPKSAFPSSALYNPTKSFGDSVVYLTSCTNCQTSRNTESRISFSEFSVDQHPLSPTNAGSQTSLNNLDRDQLFVEGYRVSNNEKSGRVSSEGSLLQDSYSQLWKHQLLGNSLDGPVQIKNRLLSARVRTPSVQSSFSNLGGASVENTNVVPVENKQQRVESGLRRMQVQNVSSQIKKTGNEVIQVYIDEKKDSSIPME